MHEARWTEVDGVAAAWLPCDGPLMAGLIFRAGQADETLPTAGRTHLLEHLVLSGLDDPGKRHNGQVDLTTTGFFTQGSPEEVLAFLGHVCAALGALPSGRLEAGKDVLAAEAATRGRWFGSPLLTWRFGARRHGLAGLPELGVATATAEDLAGLARTRFTRGNAVLWLTGPPPAGLRLPLAEGGHLAPPPLEPVLPAFPCWFSDDGPGGAAVSTLLPRRSSSTMLAALAARRLHQRLRLERSLSYAPLASYLPLDGAQAHVALYADSTPERRADLGAAFVDVVEELGRPGPAELEEVRALHRDERRNLDQFPRQAALAVARQAALDRLHGHPATTTSDLDAEVEAVTQADLEEAGRTLLAGALFALPGGVHLKPVCGVRAPLSTAAPVSGRVYLHVDHPIVDARLEIDHFGMTGRSPGGEPVTIRFAELSAVLSWRDGGLVLVGRDAAQLSIEPTMWRDGTRLRDLVLERCGPELRVDRGTRPAESIPRPTTTPWRRARARLPAVAFAVVVVLLGVGLAVGLTGPGGDRAGRSPGGAILVPIAWGLWAWAKQRRR